MQHLVWLLLLSLCIFSTFTTELFCLLSTYNVYSVCSAGQWQCTGEKCAAQCSLVGSLQVTTFDKKRYWLEGGDCAFTAVEVRYEQSVSNIHIHMSLWVWVTSNVALFCVYLGFCRQEISSERALWRMYRKRRRRTWLPQGAVSHCSPHLSHHHSFWWAKQTDSYLHLHWAHWMWDVKQNNPLSLWKVSSVVFSTRDMPSLLCCAISKHWRWDYSTEVLQLLFLNNKSFNYFLSNLSKILLVTNYFSSWKWISCP